MDIEETRLAIDAASRLGRLLVAYPAPERSAQLDRVPEPVREGLIIDTVLTYLIGRGLLLPGPELFDSRDDVDGVWEDISIPEPYADDLAQSVAREVERWAP